MARYYVRWSPVHGQDHETVATTSASARKLAGRLLVKVLDRPLGKFALLADALDTWTLKPPRKPHLILQWEHNVPNAGRFTITAYHGHGLVPPPVYRPKYGNWRGATR